MYLSAVIAVDSWWQLLQSKAESNQPQPHSSRIDLFFHLFVLLFLLLVRRLQIHQYSHKLDQTYKAIVFSALIQLGASSVMCSGQPNTSLPWVVPRQAQRAIHQLRLNTLTSAASYQAFTGRIMSPLCLHCGNGEEMAEHLLLSCPRWAAECPRHFSDSIDIKDVFQDNVSLVEFLISSGHLPPHIGTVWRAHHDNKQHQKVSACPSTVIHKPSFQ